VHDSAILHSPAAPPLFRRCGDGSRQGSSPQARSWGSDAHRGVLQRRCRSRRSAVLGISAAPEPASAPDERGRVRPWDRTYLLIQWQAAMQDIRFVWSGLVHLSTASNGGV
jgi:hypothetical protein